MKNAVQVGFVVLSLMISSVYAADEPGETAATPSAPATQEAPASVQAPTTAAAAITAPVIDSGVAPNYRIGPGDTLQVFVWRNSELSVTVPVRPDGRISTPLNEDMPAVGKTPTQLARDIETKLAEYLKKPTVNIIVTHPVSRFSQVSVVGHVRMAQSIPFQEGLTVMEAVLAVGGPDEFAALKRAKIVRTLDGVRKDIPVNLYAILEKGDMRTNIVLIAGDVIVVPESHF
jgi:polysaccharide biosynthesis/export protein